MDQILYDYALNATTWVYLSSLLSIAVFFQFNRVWSVRNLDLLGLIAFAPGLLLAQRPEADLQEIGFVWLFAIGGWFLVRMLIDPLMVRRPLLEPNLSPGGLSFLVASLLVFLMVNVLTNRPDEQDLIVARQVDQVVSSERSTTDRNVVAAELDLKNRPGFLLMMWLPSVSTAALIDDGGHLPDEESRQQRKQIIASRLTAVLSHLAVVIGLMLIGLRHFENIRAGISAAGLYLLLPYTAQMTGHIDHVLPAALLVWAVASYKFPLLAGVLLGVASGVIYYPLFLLPLWCGFYFHKGLYRFIGGVIATWGSLIGISALLLHGTSAFATSLKAMFGWSNITAAATDAGFWAFSESIAPYRIPVMVAFVVLSVGFALWPTQKNLGTLISCSAAVMLATQFWHLDRGGVYMAWYLPLLLLAVFRPNLEDRVAVSALGQAWLAKHVPLWKNRAA